MRRQDKVGVVQQLTQDLGSALAVVVVEYKGITVGSVHALRKQLREKGAGYRVVKNTLLLRAVEGSANEGLKDLAGGPIAVVYTTGVDAAGLAKVVSGYAKTEKTLVIRGGILSGKLLARTDVEELATLPSLEEMRAKALGLFNAPSVKFLNTLLAAPRDLLGVLNAKVDQDESANG